MYWLHQYFVVAVRGAGQIRRPRGGRGRGRAEMLIGLRPPASPPVDAPGFAAP